MGGRGRSLKILLVLTFADIATLLHQNTLARHGEDLGYAWLYDTIFKRLYLQLLSMTIGALLRQRLSRLVDSVAVSSCCWRTIQIDLV